MKIIFDSEEEKEKFFNQIVTRSITCPSDVGMEEQCATVKSCARCWELSIPHEIKEPEA